MAGLSDRLQELQDVASFPPPPEFVERANLTDPGVYARELADC